jgi:CRISPR-associated protein Csd1
LAGCLYRPTKTGLISTEDVEKRVGEALYASALQGVPLPIDLLYQAVLRNRAENRAGYRVTYERAALMAAVLRSHNELNETWLMETEEQMVAQLATDAIEPNIDQQARLCGQLLAILEELQRLSAQVDNRQLNATLVDRCFGAASSAPATVFGTLLTDAQAHLTKLRKNRRGTYNALQTQLENLLSVMEGFPEGFPRTLTLRQQALFSLGYYKRRAEISRGKMEGEMLKRAKDEKAAEAPTLDMDTDTMEEEEN